MNNNLKYKLNAHAKLALWSKGMKHILMGIVLATAVMAPDRMAMAAGPDPVDLLSTSNFTILAATTVTSTGGGIINGDVGLYPAGVQEIPQSQINGTIYNGGPIAEQAQLDLTEAYSNAVVRDVDRIIKSGNIGGQTLAPGLYHSTSSLEITGDLILDADGDSNAVWIFQMGSTLTTAAGADGNPESRVILAGGAKARNIFWQVGSSATLGTYSVFKGTILAEASITMDTGSVMEGRALARTGAVTFNGVSGSLPKSGQTITNFLPATASEFQVTNKVGLSAEATSLLPVSFMVGSGPGTISGGTNLAFTSTGMVSIVASQAGDTFYDPAPDVTNTYNIVPVPMLDQTITNFLPATASEFQVTNKVGLSAQATSLLPVSFMVGSGPGTITGGTNLVFTNTGMVSIVASQAGDTFYDPAPNVTNTYNIVPVPMLDQTITNFLPATASEFEGTNKVGLSAEATSLLPVSFMVGSGPGLITGSTNLVFTSTGMVSIVASQAGDTFYDPAPDVTNMYNVLPTPMLDQVITNFLPATASEFEGTNKVGLSAEATSLLPVSFMVGSGPGLITGGTNLVFISTGMVSIVASQAGSDFYDPAPDVINMYNVLPTPMLDQTITNFIPANASKFEGTNKVGLSAEATSLLPVSFMVGSGPGIITGGTNLVFISTGMVSIVASQAGSDFYNAAPDVVNTYNVVPTPMLDQTITNFIPANGSEFEGTNKVGLSAEATSLLPVSFMVGSGPGLITGATNLVFTSTGLVSVVASQAGSDFYNAAPNVTNIYNVLAAPMLDQTITNFIPGSGSEFNVTRKIGLSADASSLLPVSFMVGSGPGIITGGTNLVFTRTGTVSVVASQAGSAFYYVAPDVTNIYTILSEGMLSIVVTPAYGTWAIEGPADYQGPMSGSGSLGPINVPVGVYTVQYGPLTGFWTPESQMKTLESGDSVEFRGAYIVKVPGFGTNGIDLVVYERETGLWYALDPEDGQVLFWAEQWGGPGMIPVPGDYSGNGISDLSVYDMATGDWYIRTVDGTVMAWALNWGSEEYMPLIGDYNGNGMADLMVQSYGNGTWFGRTVGGEVLAWDISWGGTNFIAIPGDYNGDGVWDQAVYDTRSGLWYIRTIDNKLIAWAVQFGSPDMLPVAGDFDGDGVFDLAVYDHGYWYIRTLDGRILEWALPFGDETMRPVPGDYDDDGIWDLALYSESAGKWYVYSLTRGVLCWDFQFGGPGYAPLYW